MELITSIILGLVAIAFGVVLIIFAFKGRQSQARRTSNWRQRS
jgi:uncharacterized membrane protein HdeD (DUF308 family)